MNVHLIFQKIIALYYSRIPWWEWLDGPPKGGDPPQPRNFAIRDYMVAGVLRDISKLPEVAEFAPGLRSIAREFVGNASRGLVAAWEDGDDLCPPWRWPHPHWQSFEVGPQPDPWFGEALTPAMTKVVLAHGLRQLASLTSDQKISAALRQTGEDLVKSAGNRLFDEYRAIPVKPDLVRQAETRAAAS